MGEKNPTVGSSLMEAMDDYADKIEKIVEHDPDNHIEQACLYAGISGINECYKMLEKNGFISDEEKKELEAGLHRLYGMCCVE